MYNGKANSKKDHWSQGERRDEREAHREIPQGVPSTKCLIEINRFPPFVNVYTDSDWAGHHQTCKSTGVESRSGEARLFLLGQEHSSK